jgi:dienelactone hydrolase
MKRKETDVAKIMLYHSIMGLRPGILEAAERLRSRGHEVAAPDLIDGAVFSGYGEARAHLEGLGLPKVLSRAAEAAKAFGPGTVYMGFSLGAACALGAAARNPGARGCVAVAGVATVAELRAAAWPAGVDAQLHFSVRDPGYDKAKAALLGEAVRASGSRFELFEYGAGGHLFADPGLADYDEETASLFWMNVDAFLVRDA